jgi:hypothetical protein
MRSNRLIVLETIRNKRRLRARDESFTITNADPQHPIFSNFHVKSGSGLTYFPPKKPPRARHSPGRNARKPTPAEPRPPANSKWQNSLATVAG